MALRSVRIDYRLRPDADIDRVRAEIQSFIAAVKGHDATHRYSSFQHLADARRFTHFGTFGGRLGDLQAQPFFGAFVGFLRERCEEGPTVTELTLVSSTE